MDNFVFLDSKFDQNKTHTYSLSIQVSLGGFSFSIHGEEGECLVLKRSVNYSTAKSYSLKELFSIEELLGLQYVSVKVLIDVGKTSILPKDMFDLNKIDDYHQLTFGLCDNEILLYDYLDSINSYFMYSVPELLWEAINNKFDEFKFNHSMSSFIDCEMKLTQNVEYPVVYAMLSENKMHIFIPGVNMYSFYNSFSLKTDNDLIYFLLKVYEDKSLMGEFSKLKIQGELSNALLILLKKYIKHVEVDEWVDENLLDVDNAKFINLLKLYK